MAVSEQRDLRQTSLEYILLGETIDKDGNEVDLLVVSELRKRDNFRMQRREGQKGRSLRPSPKELKALYRSGNIHFADDGEERFRNVMAELNVDLDSDDAPAKSTKRVQKAKKVSKSVTASGKLDSMTVSELRDMVRDMGGSIYANSRQKNKTALIETILELQGNDGDAEATVDTTVEAAPYESAPVTVIPEVPEIEVPSVPEPDEDVVIDAIDETVDDGMGFVSDVPSDIESLDVDVDEFDAPEIDVPDDDIVVEMPSPVVSPIDFGSSINDEELEDDLSAFDSFLDGDLPGVPSFASDAIDEPVAEPVIDEISDDIKEVAETVDNGIQSTIEVVDDNLGDLDVDSMFSNLDESFDTNKDVDYVIGTETADDFKPVMDEVVESDSVVNEVTVPEKPRPTILFNLPSDDDDKIDLVDEQDKLDDTDTEDDIEVSTSVLSGEGEPSSISDFFSSDDEVSDLDDIFSDDEPSDADEEIETFDIDESEEIETFDIDEPEEIETFDIDEPEEIAEPVIPQRRRAIPQRRQGVAVGDLSDDVTPISSKINLSDSNLNIAPVVATPVASVADAIDETVEDATEQIGETFDDVIFVADDDDTVVDDDKIAVKDEESNLIDLFEDLDNEDIKTSNDLMDAFYTEGQDAVEDEPAEPANGYSGFQFAWSDKAVGENGSDEQENQGMTDEAEDAFESGFYTPEDTSTYDDLDDDFFAPDGTEANGGYDEAPAYDQYRVAEGVTGRQDYGYDNSDDSGIYEIPIDEPDDIAEDDDYIEIDDDNMPGRMTPDGYPVSDGDQRGLNDEDRGLVRKTFKRMLIAIAVVAVIGIAGIVWLMANGISVFPSIQLP